MESLSETNQQPVCTQKQETSNEYRVTSDQQPVLFDVENMVLRGKKNRFFSAFNVIAIKLFSPTRIRYMEKSIISCPALPLK